MPMGIATQFGSIGAKYAGTVTREEGGAPGQWFPKLSQYAYLLFSPNIPRNPLPSEDRGAKLSHQFLVNRENCQAFIRADPHPHDAWEGRGRKKIEERSLSSVGEGAVAVGLSPFPACPDSSTTAGLI
uniref:Uncharacterized protein n=1 Tax=Oryza sativa subsp. japonica TaxID=39947 RepID=Q69S33_ORYSJ|nr:hypothetical protein [Oryza sativa Japonica Group]